MSTHQSRPDLSGRHILVILVIAGMLVGILPIFEPWSSNTKILADEETKTTETEPKTTEIPDNLGEKLSFVGQNSLLAVSIPSNPEPEVVKTIKVVVTAYSSTVWETDEDPLITASGKMVRDGIVATNILPFGTKVRLPEVYGDETFVVEDRMNPLSKYQVDVWYPTHEDALNFGVKRTYLEVLED